MTMSVRIAAFLLILLFASPVYAQNVWVGSQQGTGSATGAGAVYNGGSSSSGTATVGPGAFVDMTDIGLHKYPDELLDSEPSGPQTVRFVVEHRNALNGHTITVKGVIISTLLGEAACPSGNTEPRMMRACAMSRITIADSDSKDRNKDYDLTILIPDEKGTDYKKGQTVNVTGKVSGSIDSVIMAKN